MSIIHDALKKVQQRLNPKTDKTPEKTPTPAENTSAKLFEEPPAIEVLPPSGQQAAIEKPPPQNKIKSIFVLICAIAIMAGSVWYLYQQFRNDIPQAQRFAKKSFYKLIHKEDIPDFKTRAPEDLKPLAQITINPPVMKTPNSDKPAALETLNVHGIMSNPSGNLALINDQVYQEGDEVDGIKIVKINLDSITVINNGTEQTIYVKD